MWNKRTNKYPETRDVIWLNCMSYKKREDIHNEDLYKNKDVWVDPGSILEERREEDNLDNLSDDSSVVNTKTEGES